MGSATVGGTMVSKIAGLSPYGGQLAAYFELVADVQAERTASMGRGNALEASVLALYAEREGLHLPLRPGGRITAESMPHAHATLDALAMPNVGADEVVVEAKTANAYEMGDWGPDGSDKVPEHYHLQALHYLGVCKAAGLNVADEAHLPVLYGSEAELQWSARLVEATGRPLRLADLEGTGLGFRVCRVEWCPVLFQALDAKVRRFLAEHVEPRVPPMPGPGDVLLARDVSAVKRGLKAEKGAALDFDKLAASDQQVLLSAVEATRQRKAWERLESEREAMVQIVLGGVEEVRGMPGGARITWRARKDGVRVFKLEEPRT